MMKILFLVLWIIPALCNQALASIEIYANGHKYDSFQEYLASKKTVIEQSPPTLVSLNSQQADDIRKEAKQMGINVDFSKVKTFQVNQRGVSDATMHQLYVLGVEHGMVEALHDFYQSWGESNFQMPKRISSEQLQEAIQQAVTTSKDPKLLISEPGKMRIMAMSNK
jgi:hypothetical protein